MASAYVFMNVEAGKVGKALTSVKALKGVKTAHAVAGPYDIILFVQAESLEVLGQRVMVEVHNIGGVRSTVTAIVFE